MVVSEVLLYISFSIIMGAFILQLIPDKKRPTIHVPKKLLLISITSIPVLSFFPLLQIILHFYQDFGFWLTFRSVLFTFEIGQAWLVTLGVSLLLLMTMLINLSARLKSISGLIYTFVLILALGWASHSASLSGWSGFIAHSAHVLAISIWVGVLLMVSWFSKDTSNWRSFLSWFHPLAIICVLVTIGAGIMLMLYVINPEDYAASWSVSYGQALLIKHLFIIPLLAYALINGYIMKRRLLQNPAFNPKPWAKVESIMVLSIFSATAILGQTAPPHNIESVLLSEGPAQLFQLFYPGVEFGTEWMISLQWNISSISFLGITCLFIALNIISFVKKAPALSLLMSVLAVISCYVALMLSIQIHSFLTLM